MRTFRRIAVIAVVMSAVFTLGAPGAFADPTPSPAPSSAAATAEQIAQAVHDICDTGALHDVLAVTHSPIGILTGDLVKKCEDKVTTILTTATGPLTPKALCDGLGQVISFPGVSSACQGVAGPALTALRAVASVVDFAKCVNQGLGCISNDVKSSTVSMASYVLGQFADSSTPDVTSAGFLTQYAIAAGLGVIVLVLTVFKVSADASSGSMGSRQYASALFTRMPLALGLIIFSPGIGSVLVPIASGFSHGIIQHETSQSAGAFVADLTSGISSFTSSGPLGLVGGLIVMGVLLAGLFLLWLGLQLQKFGLDFTAIIMAIFMGLLVSPKWSGKALRLPLTWVSVLFSQPLLFFCLGAAMGLGDSNLKGLNSSSSAADIASGLFQAGLVLVLVGLAPLMLMKFMPEMNHHQGPGTGGHGRGGAAAIAGIAGAAGAALSRRAARPAPAGVGSRPTALAASSGGSGSGGGLASPANLAGAGGVAGGSLYERMGARQRTQLGRSGGSVRKAAKLASAATGVGAAAQAAAKLGHAGKTVANGVVPKLHGEG